MQDTEDIKLFLLLLITALLVILCILVFKLVSNEALTKELKSEYNKILSEYNVSGQIKVERVGKSKLYVDTTITIPKLEEEAEIKRYKLISDLYGVHQYSSLIVKCKNNNYSATASGNNIIIKCNGEEVHSFVTMNVFNTYTKTNNITARSSEVLEDPYDYFAVKFIIEGYAELNTLRITDYNKNKYSIKVADVLTGEDWYIDCDVNGFAALNKGLAKHKKVECKLVCSMTNDEYKYQPYNVAVLHYVCWNE